MPGLLAEHLEAAFLAQFFHAHDPAGFHAPELLEAARMTATLPEDTVAELQALGFPA